MKTNAFYKVFLLAVISSSLSTHLDAQGNISRRDQLAKRRAAIASGTTVRKIKKDNGLMFEDHGVVSGFVMQNTGQLQVYYAFANRLDRELPANAALITHFVKGDSSRSDSLIPRFPNVTPWSRYFYNACYGTYQYRYEYDYTNAGSPENVYFYNAGHVSKGDTIQFFYRSDDIQTGDSVLYAIYSADTAGTGWNVIFGNVDYCIYDYTDVLNVYIGVAPEIMLGETKYYYAILENSVLKIKETTSTQLPSGAIGDDVWGDNPAAALLDQSNSGRRLGTYWEKEKPIPNGSGTLPRGMIRLVGRYWHADSSYKVNLSASNSGQTATITIEVKKPARLGNSQYAIDRRFSRDVFDHPIDIDSICIFYGGLYGIPPQLIKGQMEKESRYIDNFGFSPAYRYEPYTAQFWDEVRNRRNNPFFITNSICTPEPPTHQHVRDINYFTEVQSVWNVIVNHSQLINDIPDDPHRLYGIRTYSDTMNFDPYKMPKRIYHAFLSHYQDELGLELQEAADSARNRMIVFLRDEWDYHVPRNNKGLINVTAQTRIASSYGLLQPMYTKALLFGYQENNNYLPELLNVTDTMMVVAMRYQKNKLRNYVGALMEENNNSWLNGYENGFFLGVYPQWSTIETYPTEVFRNSRNYQPSKQ